MPTVALPAVCCVMALAADPDRATGTGQSLQFPFGMARLVAVGVPFSAILASSWSQDSAATVNVRYSPPAGEARFLGPRVPTPGPAQPPVEAALRWLADHQTESGFWDCDEFMAADKDPDQPKCDGQGNPCCDVGVTGLALLALLGNGNTMTSGPYADTVRKGATWLRTVQVSSGLFGDEVGSPTMYNHAIATMALGEVAFYGPPQSELRAALEKAVTVLHRARNPERAWRYALVPNKDNDTSVTGWAVMALLTAREAGVQINEDALEGAMSWFQNLTDPVTGRTGYILGEGAGPGSPPARQQEDLERFPAEKSESLTALALLCELLMSGGKEQGPLARVLERQAACVAARPPAWSVKEGSVDLYYWYYGSSAMHQWGEDGWNSWRQKLEQALVTSQRHDGNFAGSWDPQVDPWGDECGRVGTTAFAVLALEAGHRYLPVRDPEWRQKVLERMRPPSRQPPFLAERKPLPEGDVRDATAMALHWILRRQQDDGGFGSVRLTGLCLRCFTGAGAALREEERARIAARAARWLLARQREDGWVQDSDARDLVAHALATLALVEAFYYEGRPADWIEPLERALAALAAAPAAGDRSELFWLALAVRAGQEAGFRFDPAPQAAVSRPLLEPGGGAKETAVRVAWQLLDTDIRKTRSRTQHSSGKALVEDVKLLLEAPLAWPPAEGPEVWYFGSLALRLWGGGHWSAWRKRQNEILLPAQGLSGENYGSWPAGGGAEQQLEWTALSLLALEVEACHPPVFGK